MTAALRERPALEVADVIRQYGKAFLDRYGGVLSATLVPLFVQQLQRVELSAEEAPAAWHDISAVVTLASTSTAQNPGNLLYLVPVEDGARLTVRRIELALPYLRTPVSR